MTTVKDMGHQFTDNMVKDILSMLELKIGSTDPKEIGMYLTNLNSLKDEWRITFAPLVKLVNLMDKKLHVSWFLAPESHGIIDDIFNFNMGKSFDRYMIMVNGLNLEKNQHEINNKHMDLFVADYLINSSKCVNDIIDRLDELVGSSQHNIIIGHNNEFTEEMFN